MQDLTPEQIRTFLAILEDRRKKAPSIRKIERDAELPQSTLNQIAKGKLELTPERKAVLIPIFQRLGLLPEK